MDEDRIVYIIGFWRWVGLFPFRKVNGRYLSFHRYRVPGLVAVILSCPAFIFHLSITSPFIPLPFFFTLAFGLLLKQILILNTFFRVRINSHKVKNILEELEQIDNLLKGNGFVYKPVAPLNGYLWFSLYSFLFLLLQIVSKSLSQLGGAVVILFNRFLWICCFLQVIELLHLIQHYFRTLESLVLADCNLKQLRFLTKCYDRLCRIVSSLQDIYGFNILLATTSCFLFIIIYTAICVFSNLVFMYYKITVKFVISSLFPLSAVIFLLAKQCAKSRDSVSIFDYNIFIYDRCFYISCRTILSDFIDHSYILMYNCYIKKL